MLKTANYNLNKPEGSDVVNVNDFNSNFDTIDTKMKVVEDRSIPFALASGNANSYVATINGLTSYNTGLRICLLINVTSTGASTVNVNSLGAISILDSLGNPIGSGGLKANIPYQLCYNGSNFYVLGKGGGGNTIASHIVSGESATVDSGQIIGTMPNYGSETQISAIKTLTNLVPNGSFINGLIGWSLGSTGGIVGTSPTSKFGMNSLSVTGNASYGEAYAVYYLPYIAGHKYYVSAWVNSNIAGKTSEIYFPLSTPYPNSMITCTNANTWYQNSFISSDSTIVSGTYPLRLDNNNAQGTGVMLFDGVMVIDLTATYGAGYEPTKAQMDTLVNTFGGWFDGSTIIARISGGAYLTSGTTGYPEVLTNDSSLVSSNIKAGAVVLGVSGKPSVVDTADVTATASDVASGKTIYANGNKVTGTIPSYGGGDVRKAFSYNVNGTRLNVVPDYGIYNSGAISYVDEPNLVSSNILKGRSVFGVTGSGGYVVGDILVNQEIEHVMEAPWTLSVGLARTGTSSLCYLNGYLYCWGGSNDGIFSRVDKDGNLVNRFNGSISYSSLIAPTSSGDIFAILRGNGGSSYAYRKSLTGTTIWQSNLSSAGMTHVGTDDSNFYCASQSNSVTYITKFNGSGGVVWSKALLSTQADGVYYKNGYLYAITFGGNLYKITTDGTVVWYVGIGSPVHDLAIDEQDNVWVTFNTSVAKVSSNGVKLFSVNNQSTPYSVVTDKLNYLYVGSSNSITCYNSDGAVMWSKAISNTPYGLVVDDEYSVYYIISNDSNLNKIRQYYRIVR